MAQVSRVEIIANQAVEADLFDRMEALQCGQMYTKMFPVFGKGKSGSRHGDHIWPEENILLLFYCSPEERDRIITAAKQVKQMYPDEGIKIFSFDVEMTEI